MNTNLPKKNKIKYKTIYSLRIRIALRNYGFEPVAEMQNPYKKRLQCWRYIDTVEFEDTLSKIMRGEC